MTQNRGLMNGESLVLHDSMKSIIELDGPIKIQIHPPQDNEADSCDQDGLAELKKVTARLHLDTRRPSIVEWMARRSGGGDLTPESLRTGSWASQSSSSTDVDSPEKDDGGWTQDRVNGINSALAWLRQELLDMRAADAALARQLISLRAELHRLKLAKSCGEHAALLEDVALALEERDELAELCDIPIPLPREPLRDLGVTRMNFISARRFSLC